MTKMLKKKVNDQKQEIVHLLQRIDKIKNDKIKIQGQMNAQKTELTNQINDLSNKNEKNAKDNKTLIEQCEMMKHELEETKKNNDIDRQTSANDLMKGIHKVKLNTKTRVLFNFYIGSPSVWQRG